MLNILDEEPIHVLLVEDDPESGQATKTMLERRGLQVTLVGNVSHALSVLSSVRFDGVVADIRLGEMSGVDLLRHVRKNHAEFPVILITGYDDLTSAIEAVRLGAQNYILKPFDAVEDLLVPLQTAILHHRTTLENRILARNLKESERRFREFFENEPEYCYMISPAGIILDVNRSALRALGYDKAELLGRPFGILYAPECAEKASQAFERWKATGELRDMELTILAKNNRRREVMLNASAVRNEQGEILHSVSIQCDITERKHAEIELAEYRRRLQVLASELTVAEYTEREHLAKDLHESVAQLLALCRINLDFAAAQTDFEKAREIIRQVGDLLGQSLDQIRSLTFDLYPPVLYVKGLEPALRELAHRTQKWCGLVIEVRSDSPDVPLAKDMKAFLFRAVRDSLQNVVKHARARRVQLSLLRDAHSITIELSDDGCGFDVEQGLSKGGLGLFGVRERILAMGGAFQIASAPGKGTTVCLTAPLQPGQADSTTPVCASEHINRAQASEGRES